MKYTANASEKFTSDLRKAIHIARLAPSSHNSQPWLVNVIDSNRRHFTTVNIEPDNSYYIAIEFDSERVLSSLAKLNDEMYISCGIFTQYVCLCLSHSGYQSTITWVDKGNTIAIIKIQYHAEVEGTLEELPGSGTTLGQLLADEGGREIIEKILGKTHGT